jgi:hypothetical protein
LLERLRGLYSDVAIIYLHVILPEDLATWLPPLVETWKDFAGASQSDPDKARSPRPRGRKEYFEKFLESIRPCEKSCGYFLHSLVPHPPWEYLPSGKVYHPSTVYGMESSYWGEEEWWVMQAYQRHLLQVKFVDNLLRKLLSHLKSIGMYDRSLIVVTADHGRSFWPKERHRNLNGAKYPEDILGVPLLIKAPFQRKGIVSDRNVQTIDIFPTLADLLKIQIPWPVDGCSAVSKSCPERNEKIAVDSRGKKTRFDAEVLRREDSLKRKLALFRSGTKNIGPLNVGPYRHIVGRRAAEFGVNNAVGAGVSLFPAPEWSKMDPDAFSPARVTAFFYPGEKIEGAVYVAISVDGTIQAVAPALPDKERALIVSAMLPEETVKSSNEFQFFMVKGTPDKPELYRISRK